MLRTTIQGIITTLLAAAAVLLCAFSVAYCSFVERDVTTLAGILSVVLAYAAGHSATASMEKPPLSLPRALLKLAVMAVMLDAAFSINAFSRSYIGVIEIELSLIIAALSMVFAFAAGFWFGMPWETESTPKTA